MTNDNNHLPAGWLLASSPPFPSPQTFDRILISDKGFFTIPLSKDFFTIPV